VADPLFSIVTVTRNSATTVGRTIASVRAQSFRDFEYLLIDGGSTDGTVAILEASSDIVSRVTSEKDRGISDAFNKGLALARGSYVGMINSDDWYEPDALQRVAEAIRRLPADVYCGRQRYWDEAGPSSTFDVRPELLPSFMSINHMATFARRQLFVEHGGFRLDYRLAMDYELFLRFFQRGARFQVLDAVLANMALGGVSDQNWMRSVGEVRRAQLENGVSYLAAQRHFLFQVAKGMGRRWLDQLGAAQVTREFRRRLARVPKREG
jgi:glycosyltransferase involved in cell wall biosynthesis